MLSKKKIAFLGAGSMAEAMIAGITNTSLIPPKQIYVSNRSNKKRLQSLEKGYGINGVTKEKLNLSNIDIIVLAMKPKDAETSLLSIKESIRPNQLILSVLAGVTTSFMEQYLPKGQQVIRVMPNTSSMIGESATAISSGTYTTKESMSIAKELLHSIGEVYVIPEEKMDIFTGIAGSGPAYFYYLMEHMEQEGLNAGLTTETTRQIIAQTIVGAAKMIQEQGETPATLRENVTSPNGTTAAGLAALALHGGGKAISQAIKHAANRSKEISSQLEESLKKIPNKQKAI
ncbi:pyrroline-5-carboxylate reductase [Neobacillus sp. D3-1R]|uniref:pyrroline-5-carboxylate reductase n=1 Tax=Neobacillus sp. D3-1R TaxID=3445778 RepID=UPI003FA113C9